MPARSDPGRRRRRSRTWLAAAALVLFLVAGARCAMKIEDRLLYFPERYPASLDPRAATGLPGVEELRVASDGAELVCWLAPAAEPGAPAVVWFHGNAGHIAHRAGDLARLHRALDATILAVEYRGYGLSTGEPSERGLQHDAHAAFDALAARPGIDPRRIVALGQSLGGAVAIELAAERPLAGLVVESSFTTLGEMARLHYGWLALLARSQYDSLSKVPRLEMPKLFVHGALDDIVPLEMGRRLHAAAREPKELLVLDRAGHNDVADVGGAAYLARLRAFVHAAGGRE